MVRSIGKEVTELLDYFVSEEFKHFFQKAERLGKLVAITVIKELVNKFDLGIKDLEASEQFEGPIKLMNFQRMLKKYFSLLHNWIPLTNTSFTDVNEQLRQLNDVLNKTAISKQDLTFSQNFDVQAYNIGAATKYGLIGKSITLEDVFSSIHQDLLVILASLSLDAGADKIPLAKIWEEKIRSFQSSGAELIGVQIEPMKLSFSYNHSLRGQGIGYCAQ